MADLHAALAAVREALHEHDAYGMPIDAGTIRDLLAALDAAQGEAVAWRWEEREYNDEWKVRHGEAVPEYENQPRWVRNAAPLCLAPPAAPRVERYGDGVLVHWPEGVEQYVQVGDCVTGNIAAPPAAVPAEAWLTAKYYEWQKLNDGSPLFVFLRREAAQAPRAAVVNPESADFKEGMAVGRAESEFLAAAIKNPACGLCGATCAKDAEAKCRPGGDTCPGIEWPLANLWAMQVPPAAVPAGYVSMPVERVQHVIDLLAERAEVGRDAINAKGEP